MNKKAIWNFLDTMRATCGSCIDESNLMTQQIKLQYCEKSNKFEMVLCQDTSKNIQEKAIIVTIVVIAW